MDQAAQQSITRRDQYQPPAWRLLHCELQFDLDAEHTRVESRLAIERPAADDGRPLDLDAAGLEIERVAIDGRVLAQDEYHLGAERLTLHRCPAQAVVSVVNFLHPALNTTLEGLFHSRGILLTQCEAEGFRKIACYPDRPDVLAPFKVTLRADRERYPVLLSNGNLTAAGALPDGRHFTVWEDPFPKPSYLFALVAGDLAQLADEYTTRSGRLVQLRIYAENRDVARLAHAMAALRAAMRWDEETYGLEYDLDVYHIVVTDDFNMGAMENRSLNIFNAKYVVADQATTTDEDYQAIRRVIGHEYFHNWTGNRVTCRDWFQLTLKEGLTVYRDQEFTADGYSRPVERIRQMRHLRRVQFPEDAGPQAHPIRPEQYLEIDNFYTATVYLKGAEIVRLYETLLGKKGFRRGLRHYLEKHDGRAATCEDFLEAMGEANGRDLGALLRWYEAAGTPRVKVETRYDAAAREWTMQLTQTLPGGGPALPIPLRLALLDDQGRALPLQLAGEAMASGGERVLMFDRETARYTFINVPVAPLPSLLRGFSAPVIIEHSGEREELARLVLLDDDGCARFDAAQGIYLDTLHSLVDGSGQCGVNLILDPVVRNTWQALLRADADPALTAELLSWPTLAEYVEMMSPVKIEAAHKALTFIRRSLGMALEDDLLAVYRQCSTGDEEHNSRAMGRRSLKNLCLDLLVATGGEAHCALAEAQYDTAGHFTDRFAALSALAVQQAPGAAARLADFVERYREQPLVIDKWFALNAQIPAAEQIDRVLELMAHPLYQPRNPNRVRALLGTFTQANPVAFHHPGGASYALLAEEVLAIDRDNPQLAARLVPAFNRWRHFDAHRQGLMRGQLERIRSQPGLSPGVFELVSKALAG